MCDHFLGNPGSFLIHATCHLPTHQVLNVAYLLFFMEQLMLGIHMCTHMLLIPLGTCLIVTVENMTSMTLYVAALQTNVQVSLTFVHSDCVPGRAFYPLNCFRHEFCQFPSPNSLFHGGVLLCSRLSIVYTILLRA